MHTIKQSVINHPLAQRVPLLPVPEHRTAITAVELTENPQSSTSGAVYVLSVDAQAILSELILVVFEVLEHFLCYLGKVPAYT